MTKTFLISSLVLLSIAFASCGKVTRNGKINRDCTGTYLELNDKDYLICNPSMTNSIADGSSVRVKYKSLNSCPSDPYLVICELYHLSYGFVEITEIE